MAITEELYRQVVLADPEGRWELHRGRLREKPPMSAEHNYLLRELTFQLVRQIDPSRFVVSPNVGRLAQTDENNYIPDVFVVERAREQTARRRGDLLETYRDPMPLVVEIWSPSTGTYDTYTKVPEYKQRGDREIWLLHPIERTLWGWRIQPDGTYQEFTQREGTVEPVALPGVRVDLDALFAPPE